MPSFDDLREVLVDCKIVSGEQWARAVRHAGNVDSIAALLSALGATTPWWWDNRPPAPPGLTEYQHDVILTRYAEGKLNRIRAGLVMNKFLLLDHLGEGGQGRVYRARQLQPKRDVAIKILTHDTDDRRKRFEQEARTMLQIHHPAVARLYQYERVRDENGETDDYLLAMEYINGTDMQRLVRRGTRVPWRFAVWWVAGVLEGLDRVHAAGFIHRDVKPENIMIVGPPPADDVPLERTTAKLLDLGAAKPTDSVTGDGITRTGIFIGTPEYAPPEQWSQTGTSTPASDIYALGGTLYYALTGRSPYQKDVRNAYAYLTSHVNDPVPNIREYNEAVPRGVNDLFRKMMAKDPAERGTALEVAAELRALLEITPSPRTRPRPAGQPPSDVVRTRTDSPRPADPAPPPKPQPRTDDEEPSLGLVSFFERILLPAELRDAGGGLSTGERVQAMIRRPFTIFLFLALLALVAWCVWWR